MVDYIIKLLLHNTYRHHIILNKNQTNSYKAFVSVCFFLLLSLLLDLIIAFVLCCLTVDLIADEGGNNIHDSLHSTHLSYNSKTVYCQLVKLNFTISKALTMFRLHNYSPVIWIDNCASNLYKSICSRYDSSRT